MLQQDAAKFEQEWDVAKPKIEAESAARPASHYSAAAAAPAPRPATSRGVSKDTSDSIPSGVDSDGYRTTLTRSTKSMNS